jgi:hypothetical protein
VRVARVRLPVVVALAGGRVDFVEGASIGEELGEDLGPFADVELEEVQVGFALGKGKMREKKWDMREGDVDGSVRGGGVRGDECDMRGSGAVSACGQGRIKGKWDRKERRHLTAWKNSQAYPAVPIPTNHDNRPKVCRSSHHRSSSQSTTSI